MRANMVIAWLGTGLERDLGDLPFQSMFDVIVKHSPPLDDVDHMEYVQEYVQENAFRLMRATEEPCFSRQTLEQMDKDLFKVCVACLLLLCSNGY